MTMLFFLKQGIRDIELVPIKPRSKTVLGINIPNIAVVLN